MQIGKVCQIDGVYKNLVTCSNNSILTSLHLALISQMLKVSAKTDVSRTTYTCTYYVCNPICLFKSTTAVYQSTHTCLD